MMLHIILKLFVVVAVDIKLASVKEYCLIKFTPPTLHARAAAESNWISADPIKQLRQSQFICNLGFFFWGGTHTRTHAERDREKERETPPLIPLGQTRQAIETNAIGGLHVQHGADQQGVGSH